MDGLTPQYDSAREIVAYELEPGEIDELREWFCYTKPIGPSVKIVATSGRSGSRGLCVLSAGTEPEMTSAETARAESPLRRP